VGGAGLGTTAYQYLETLAEAPGTRYRSVSAVYATEFKMAAIGEP
jgi:hypothetical protein